MGLIPEKLKPYAKQLGYPTSATLGHLFTILFDTESKINIAVALPGSVFEVAEKSGLSIEETEQALKELHQNGVVYKKRDHQVLYKLYPGIIELRDASVLTPGISTEMICFWDDLIRTESLGMIPELVKLGVPPMMRVIPIEETVESKNQVLDIESARQIIQEATRIVALPCACRTARKAERITDCPAPQDLNMCFMINRFGDEAIDRGIGEVITAEEAVRRLKTAEDAGLVHMTRNNVKKDMILCNCCACCCTGLFMLNELNYASLEPSRFRVKLDEDACIGCETCQEQCQFSAIKMGDIAQINLEKCFGCGVCVEFCPGEALILEEFRPKEHIRMT